MGTYFYFVIETRPSPTVPWTAVYNSHQEEGYDGVHHGFARPHPLAHLHLPWKCYGLHAAFRELRALHAVPPPTGWGGPLRCFPDDATVEACATFQHSDATGWAYLEDLHAIELTDAWQAAEAEKDTYYAEHRRMFVTRVRPGLAALATGPRTVRMVWGFS